MTAHEALPRVSRLIAWHARRHAGPRRGDARAELEQDATVRLLENFPKFDGDPDHLARFTTWMCSGAARDARTRQARAARVAAHLRDLAARSADRRGHRPHQQNDTSATEQEEQIARLAALPAAVDRLPAHQRDAVVRVFGLDGHAPRTREAVATALGVSRKAVGQRVQRAVAALRDLLTEA